MAEHCETFESAHIYQAWSLLNEYYDFHRIARQRRKLEEHLHDANILLTQIPWKSMVRAVLCHNLFTVEELQTMTIDTAECLAPVDIISSQTTVNIFLENNQEDEINLTETWFEVEELKQRLQRAMQVIPTSRRARREMLHRILGYPAGYVESEIDNDFNRNDDDDDDQSLDLMHVLPIDEQRQMHTGDLIELSENRLHDAFYIYRLPQKGIWKQIQQMWSKHETINFVFNDTEEEEEEILLIPAMDEYGYGVPYLFARTSTASLPDGAIYKYVDINCPHMARHTENSTIAVVQQHLNERLKNPVYQDEYMGEEMSVELDRFPQEYVAMVHINDAPTDNVVWTRRVHYDGTKCATDLNDNIHIFFSRRILEAEEQYRQWQSKDNSSSN